MKRQLYFKLNGMSIICEEPTEAVSMTLSAIDNMQYWSYESLVKLYKGIIRIVVGCCKEIEQECFDRKDKTKLTRFLKQAKNMSRFIPKDREGMLRKIYETILVGEKLGLLRGLN